MLKEVTWLWTRLETQKPLIDETSRHLPLLANRNRYFLRAVSQLGGWYYFHSSTNVFDSHSVTWLAADRQQQQRWSRKLRAHIRRIKGVDFAGRSFQVNLSMVDGSGGSGHDANVQVCCPALGIGRDLCPGWIGRRPLKTLAIVASTQFQPSSRYVDINNSTTTTTKWTKGSKHLFPYSSVVVVFNSSSSEGYLLLQLTFSLWLRGSCTGEGMWIRNDLAGNVLKNIYSYTHPRVVFQFKRMVLEDLLLDARLL